MGTMGEDAAAVAPADADTAAAVVTGLAPSSSTPRVSGGGCRFCWLLRERSSEYSLRRNFVCSFCSLSITL